MDHVVLGVPQEEGFVGVGPNVGRRQDKGLKVIWGVRADSADDTGSLDTSLQGCLIDKELGQPLINTLVRAFEICRASHVTKN